jgi:hypothetical protein
MDYDSPWKEAMEHYFEAFIGFFFPEIHKDTDWTRGYEFLDKELEKEIANQYEEYDKDPRTGKFLGKTSILKIAERAVRIRKLGEATGSKTAQTTVLDKRQGALKTSGGQPRSSDE